VGIKVVIFSEILENFGYKREGSLSSEALRKFVESLLGEKLAHHIHTVQ
jgi:hypothetical protein